MTIVKRKTGVEQPLGGGGLVSTGAHMHNEIGAENKNVFLILET